MNRFLRPPQVWDYIFLLALWLLVAFGVDASARATIAYFTSVSANQDVKTFLTSPGAAGSAALAGATIAAIAVSLQLRQNRTVEHRKSWWNTFEWTVEKTFSEDQRRSLPIAWALEILSEMVNDSTADLNQKRACSSTVNHFTQVISGSKLEEESSHHAAVAPGTGFPEAISEDGRAEAPEQIGHPENLATPPSAEALHPQPRLQSETDVLALERYVSATRGTAGSSPAAEAFLYEHSVSGLLHDVINRIPESGLTLAMTPPGGSYDMLLRFASGAKLGIEIITSRDPRRIRLAVSKMLATAERTGDFVLVITPIDLPDAIRATLPERVNFVRMSDFSEQEVRSFHDALKEVAERAT